MKKGILFFAVIPAAIIAAGLGYKYIYIGSADEKVYVSVEGDGKVIAINPSNGRIAAVIDLSVEHSGMAAKYTPRDLKISKDMKTVWVAANTGEHQGHTFSFLPRAFAHGNAGASDADEVIVIDPVYDTIIKRISIGSGAYLTRLEFSEDGFSVFVTAEARRAMYKINAKTFIVEDRLSFVEGSGSAGIGRTAKSSDGKRIYSADAREGTVSIKDAGTGGEIYKINIGSKPGSVGVWEKR